MNVSDAQSKSMDALIRGEKTLEQIPVRTRHILLEKGLVGANGLVTQEGLKYVSVGVIEVDVILFGSDVHYSHPYWLNKEKTRAGRLPLTFPKGTEMVVTFAIEDKKYGKVYEGMIQMNGKPIWVRLYRNPHFSFTKRLMPVKDV